MRLRRNQLCPRFTTLSSAAAEKRSRERNGRARWASGALKIRIIPGDTGNSALTVRCGSSSTRRSLHRMASAHSARKGSPTMVTLCPTMSIPEEWEEPGETIIRRTFRQFTGGATGRRGRAGNERRTRVSG